MRVLSVRAKNLLSYDDFELDCSDLNIIVGPNNAGKSNLFRLFRFIQNLLTRQAFPNPELLLHNPDGVGFDVELDLELDETQTKTLSEFLRLHLEAISVTTPRNQLQLGTEEPEQVKMVLSEFNSTFAPAFSSWLIGSLKHGKLRLRYAGFPGQMPTLRYTIPIFNGKKAGFTLFEPNLRQDMPGGGDNVLQAFTTFLAPKVGRWGGDITSRYNLEQGLKETRDIGGFLRHAFRETMGINNVFVSYNDLTQVGLADTLVKLSRIMQGVGLVFPINGQASFGDLLFKLIENSISLSEEFRSRPNPRLEANSHLDVKRAPESQNVALFLFKLMTSSDYSMKQRYADIRSAFASLFNREFEFDVSSVEATRRSSLGGQEEMTLLSLTITNVSKKRTVPIEFAGSGMAEILYVLTLIVGLEDSVIFLDEPAAHLHPGIQRRLLQEIQLASNERSNQIFLISHSSSLIPISRPELVTRFYLEEGSTKHVGMGNNPDARSRIIKMIERSPRLLNAIFSDKTILFEGEYEQAALSVWFPKCEPPLRLDDSNVESVIVAGDGSFRPYYELLSSWHIPAIVIGDALAATVTEGLESQFLIKEEDLSDLLEQVYPEVFQEALSQFPAKQRGKNPQIARFVAERTNPPDEIKVMAETIRKFLHA